MVVYKLVWEDRSGSVTKWFGTKKELKAYKAEVARKSAKRPYDHIELAFSGTVDIPTSKAALLSWLNNCVR